MKLVSKTGATSITVGGQTFEPDADGVFEVPAELAGPLVTPAHGFIPQDQDRSPPAGASIRSRGGGWYDVLDAKGNTVNAKAIGNMEDAEALVMALNQRDANGGAAS
jgi:hypothetical protein